MIKQIVGLTQRVKDQWLLVIYRFIEEEAQKFKSRLLIKTEKLWKNEIEYNKRDEGQEREIKNYD